MRDKIGIEEIRKGDGIEYKERAEVWVYIYGVVGGAAKGKGEGGF